MAKNKDLDDFDLDDLDDFDMFGEPPKSKNGKKRSAVLETATTVRKSALNTILPKGRRDQIILKGLPDSAGDAYEGFKDARYAASDILSHTKEELVKTERLLQQQTRAAMPTIKKFLPNSITSKIGKWADKSKVDLNQQYDAQQATIDRAMSEVFGAIQAGPVQSKTEIAKEQEEAQKEAVEDKLKETVNTMRQDAMHDTLIGIAKDVRDLAGINRSTMVNVARRSLELQYRQLFALQDIAKIAQSRFDRDTPALEAIVKNTGLPDYAKEEFSEVWKAQTKRRVAEFISPRKFLESFFPRFSEKTNKAVSNASSMFRQMASAVLEGASEDNFDLEDTSELSPEQRRSNLAQKGVGVVTSKVIDKFINPTRDKYLDKTKDYINKNMPGLAKFLSKSGYNFYNIGAISNSAAAGENNSLLGDITKIGQNLGLVDVYKREKVGFDLRDATNLQASVGFDRRTWISINEVIPAWLGKINQSIRSMSGDAAPDETYDLTTRKFVNSNVIANRIRKHIAGDEGKDRMERNVQVVIDFIDPNKKLSNDTRKGVSRLITDAVYSAKEVNLNYIVQKPSLLSRYLGSKGIEEFIKVINSRAGYFDGGLDEFNLELSKKIRELTNGVSSVQKRLRESTDLYGEHLTMKAGIIKYNGAKDILETDKDLFDINTRFRSLESGKLTKGKATDIKNAVEKAKASNSATWHYLKDRANYMDAIPSNETEPNGKTLSKILETTNHGSNITLSNGMLSSVLYGETNTNLAELLKTYNNDNILNRTSETDRIVNAINGNKETIISILEHVRSMDEDGIILDKMAESDDAEGPPTRKWWQILKKRKDRKEAKAKRNAEKRAKSKKGFFGKVFGGIGSTFKWGRDKGRWAKLRIKNAMFNPFTAAGNVARGAFKGVTGTLKGLLGIRDVYDEKGNVVLEGTKLKNGEYFQIVNDKLTPLTKLDDIDLTKDILDSNNNVVISAADLATKGKLSYYSTGKWWGLAERIGGSLGAKVPEVLKVPLKFLKGRRESFKKRLNDLFNYPDMYIDGQFETPVLRAEILKRGGYLLRDTGEVITSPSDVTGAVVDRQNNIILSDEDIKKEGFALVDINGKPVKTGLGKIIGRVTAPIRWGWKQLKKIPKNLRKLKDRVKDFTPFRKLGEGWDWLKDKAKGIFSSDGVKESFVNVKNTIGGIGSRKRTNAILMRIYKLLNKRMPGEPEDEGWINDSFTKEAYKGVRGFLGSVKDRIKKLFEHDPDRQSRFGKLKDAFKGKLSGLSDAVKRRLGIDPDLVGPKQQSKLDRLRGKFSGIKDKILGGRLDGFKDKVSNARSKIKSMFGHDPEFIGPPDPNVIRRYKNKFTGEFKSKFKRMFGVDPEFIGPMPQSFYEKYKNIFKNKTTGGVNSLKEFFKKEPKESKVSKRRSLSDTISDSIKNLLTLGNKQDSHVEEYRKRFSEGGSEFVGPKRRNKFLNKYRSIAENTRNRNRNRFNFAKDRLNAAKNMAVDSKAYKSGKILFGNTLDKLLGRNDALKQEALDLLENKAGLSWEERQEKARDIRARMDTRKEKRNKGIMNSIREKFFKRSPKGDATDPKGKKEETITQKLSRLINLQEITWFDRMRRSAREDGMPESVIGRMFYKFARRVKFNKDGEKRDFLKWFRRRKKKDDAAPTKPGKMNKAKKGVLGTLLTGILGGVGSVLSSVLGTAGSLAVDGLAMLGRGALSLLAPVATFAAEGAAAVVSAVGWPVIAAVAAVGAVTYLAYKYFKPGKTKYLDKMRMAQYGVPDYDNYENDGVAKCLYLESELKKTTAFTKDGGPQLRGINQDVLFKMAEGLELDTKNNTEMLSFYAWLKQRVIPIYLRWARSLNGMPNPPKLEDVGDINKVSPDDMLLIYEKAFLDKDSDVFKNLQDPRYSDRGFFGKVWDTITFADTELLDGEDVVDICEDVKKEIESEKRYEENTKDKSSYYDGHAKGIKDRINERESNAIKNLSNEVNRQNSMLGNLDNKYDLLANKIAGALSTKESLKLMVDDYKADDKDLNCLTAIRMKAYGLTTMDQDKVRLLRRLENYITKNLDKSSISFKGSVSEALDIVCLSSSKGDANARTEAEIWFRRRFINVALTHVMMVRRYFPNTEDPFNVNSGGSWMYSTASVIVTTTYTSGSITGSIWNIAESPFESMSSNTDRESIANELASLERTSTRKDLPIRDLIAARNKYKPNDSKTIKDANGNEVTTQKKLDEIRKKEKENIKKSDVEKLLNSGGSTSAVENVQRQAYLDNKNKGNPTNDIETKSVDKLKTLDDFIYDKDGNKLEGFSYDIALKKATQYANSNGLKIINGKFVSNDNGINTANVSANTNTVPLVKNTNTVSTVKNNVTSRASMPTTYTSKVSASQVGGRGGGGSKGEGYANGATVSKYRSGEYSAPVVDPLITSPYGPRNVPGGSKYHRGIDLRGAFGDPIFAACSGVVDECGGDYNQIGILHDSGERTRYLHCSKIGVTKGEKVKVGSRIGSVGGKGPRGVNQYAPHLHFEAITSAGVKVDPEKWLNDKGIPTPHKGDDDRLNQLRISKALANAQPFIGDTEAGSGVKDDPNAQLPDSNKDTSVVPPITSANVDDIALSNIVDRADAIDTKSKLDSAGINTSGNNLKAVPPTSVADATDKASTDKSTAALANKIATVENMSEDEKEEYNKKVAAGVTSKTTSTRVKAEKELSNSTVPNYENVLSDILSVNVTSRDHLDTLVRLVTTIVESKGSTNVNTTTRTGRTNNQVVKPSVLSNSRNKNA